MAPCRLKAPDQNRTKPARCVGALQDNWVFFCSPPSALAAGEKVLRFAAVFFWVWVQTQKRSAEALMLVSTLCERRANGDQAVEFVWRREGNLGEPQKLPAAVSDGVKAGVLKNRA